MAGKPTVGIYSFTGCEGCSLMILECEDQLLDVLELVEIVNFREGMDKIADQVDVAFVDGLSAQATTSRNSWRSERTPRSSSRWVRVPGPAGST